MLIRKPGDIPSSEITDETLYLSRRKFIGVAGVLGAAAVAGAVAPRLIAATRGGARGGPGPKDELGDEATSWDDITSYNNYYEFGTAKDDPKANAQHFRARPWSVVVDGMVRKPAAYHLEDFISPWKLEDRVYRLRCVEAWSMVIPWLGFPVADVLTRAEPLPGARYVELTTLYDPAQMPGQKRGVLPWPYVEGLRLDEAMHPLAIFATGLYGKPLPNQDGAPLRLVVPWKYGFKSIKAIVRVRLTATPPRTTWAVAAPDEYGFYANVNPHVDHPRWSQAKERRIGEWRRRETLMFNGYAAQVAHLYAGMDLRKNF